MFINRKSRKLSKNYVANQIMNESVDNHRHTELELASYPSLQYFLGFLLLATSIYFLYSVSGGTNAIKGFNEGLWWQYIIALIPMALGLCFILAFQIESLSISRKDDWIVATKTRIFCFVSWEAKRKFSDLIGLSVVKVGKEMNNITMTNYHISLSFGTCEQISILRCMSEGKISDYFEAVRRVFSEEEILQKKITIQNLIS